MSGLSLLHEIPPCNQLIPPFVTTHQTKKNSRGRQERDYRKRELKSSQGAMGIVISKCYENPIQLKARIQVLEEEIKELKRVREREAKAYEEEENLFGCKEKEWKRERKKHEEETAKIRKMLKEEEDRIRSLEGEVMASREEDKEWQQYWMGTEHLVEHMKEEQAQREVAVEKWKQLYLTIKTELDDLILMTRQGGRFCLGREEGMIEGLQRELNAMEETVEALRSHVSALEKEGVKREREIDILRQSLRILSNTKKWHEKEPAETLAVVNTEYCRC